MPHTSCAARATPACVCRVVSWLAQGPSETTTWIKQGITPKIGQQWNTQFERNGSRMKSGVYAGSIREPTSRERVEFAGGKSPFL